MAGDVCYSCQKAASGKPEFIGFVHKGIKLRTFKSGLKCAECVKKELKKKFDSQEGILFQREGENLIVKWSEYVKVPKNPERQSEDEVLLAAGIFSHSAVGNWEIVDSSGGLSLNPRAHTFLVFFTQKDDAATYAALEFSNTLYGWEVRRIEAVFSKKEVLTWFGGGTVPKPPQ